MALERPTVLRQLALLAAIAAAFLTRPQFGILYATWVGALALLWLIVAGDEAPDESATSSASGRRRCRSCSACSPSPRGSLSGASARDSLGAYWELWRGYDPLQVGKWFVYHLGDFAVYLAVVPVAVAPIVLWELARAGRAGSRPAAAFVALFASANVSGLLVVAAFTSTPWGYDRLHDRYGFYLLPLWLVGLVVWLASGLPRPLRRGRDRRRRGARAPADPPLPAARERGGDRHRPGRALGADRGGAGRARAGVRPPRARALRPRRSSPRRFLLPRTDCPRRAPGRSWPSRSPPRRTSRGSA